MKSHSGSGVTEKDATGTLRFDSLLPVDSLYTENGQSIRLAWQVAISRLVDSCLSVPNARKVDDMIYLHKDKGMNPCLCYCPRCKGDSPSIVFLGNQDKIYVCDNCGMQHIGYPDKPPVRGNCPKCHIKMRFDHTIEKGERIPGEYCDNCVKEMEEHRKIVEAGGLYFRCKDCGCEGVIQAKSEFAINLRKEQGIPAPKLLRIEFDKNNCPSCKKQD